MLFSFMVIFSAFGTRRTCLTGLAIIVFPRWFSRRPRPVPREVPVKKVVLFSSCLVNYQVTDVGKAAVQVLEKNGVEVARNWISSDRGNWSEAFGP